MIRAMPCPECGAEPRKFCNRKPQKNGRIRNHEARMLLWHNFVESVQSKKKPEKVNDRDWHPIDYGDIF